MRACARSGCVCVRGNSASSKRVRSQGGVRFTGRTYRQKWVDSRGGGRKKSKRATAGGRRGAGTGEGRPGRGGASRGRRCWQSPVSGTQQDMRTCKRSTRKTHSSAHSRVGREFCENSCAAACWWLTYVHAVHRHAPVQRRQRLQQVPGAWYGGGRGRRVGVMQAIRGLGDRLWG